MNLLHELKRFHGSEEFYEFRPLGQHPVFNYTEGVKYLAEKGACFWLLDAIASYQGQAEIKAQPFQTWELEVSDNNTAVLQCHDGHYNYLVTQKIPFTDIPLKSQKLSLYLVDRTLLLTNEY